MHIIIEGIDHCGKDTLIDSLLWRYGGRVHHCGKPILCFPYTKGREEHDMTENEKNLALYYYQRDYFVDLFDGIHLPKYVPLRNFEDHNFNVYYNRCHLGEYVYGKLYRNYSQEMMDIIFKLEDLHLFTEEKSYDNWVRLILLAMHHPENRIYDRDAFSNENGKIEQKLFIDAFNKSKIHKAIIFVDTPDGKWRPKSDILNDVLEFLRPIK